VFCAAQLRTAGAQRTDDERLALQAPAPAPAAPAAPTVPPAPGAPPPAPAPPTPEAPPELRSEPSPAAPSGEPQSTTAPEPTPSAEALAMVDAANLAALGSELASAGVAELQLAEPHISVYGFADFTYTTQVGKKFAPSPDYGSFMVGNLNVYLSTEFERHWRSLAEVRFTYLPHGSYWTDNQFADRAALERVDSTVLDPSDLNRPVRLGGIAIQRVWLEYNFDTFLTLRAGQWLTPYGIWNVDHGSPTIIGIFRPYVINENLFPERQTGLEAYGGFYVEDTKVGYHLTLSNGRGPIDSYQDLDSNLGVGARLYVYNDSLLGTFTLGISGYKGSYTDRSTAGIAVEDGVLVDFNPPTLQYDELALAADLKWEWEGLLVQGEAIYREVSYLDATRPVIATTPPPPVPGQYADSHRFGVYGIVAYRTPWWNIMPFMLAQFTSDPYASDAKELAFGVNVRPSPRVALKVEYKYVFIEEIIPGIQLGDLDFVGFQVAWSF
jgi:hypothetical protein